MNSDDSLRLHTPLEHRMERTGGLSLGEMMAATSNTLHLVLSYACPEIAHGGGYNSIRVDRMSFLL